MKIIIKEPNCEMVHSVSRCDSDSLANLRYRKHSEEEKSLEKIVKYTNLCKKNDIISIHQKLANLHDKLFVKNRKSFDRIQTGMDHKFELKTKPIQGYLEILDVDEVELRHPNRHNEFIGENTPAERPFSLPSNLQLASTLYEPDEPDVDPVKRNSFLRQSYNTIRKSFRFKNRRKSNSVSDDQVLMNKSILSDKNNNRNGQLNKKIHLISDDESKVKMKKSNKHLRNSSLGSYFALR